MNRRGVWVLMVMSALMVLVCVPKAWGQRPPETVPVGLVKESHVMSYDRSSMPSAIQLFATRTILGYSADVNQGLGRIHLTCRSKSDSINGACAESDTGNTETGTTQIALRFVEQRTGLNTDVLVTGSLQRAYGDIRCYRDFWNNVDRPLTTTMSPQCIDSYATGTGAEMALPGYELEKLVAGHWIGKLSLDLRTESSGPVVATYEFDFDLTITDHNAVSIYLPQFESTTPLVNLDARYDPIQQTVGGRTVVEMCLYDGLGSQASYLAVTARDISPRSAGNSGFSLWHDSSGSDASQRLDYTITLDHNGARVPLNNGVEEQLTGIDSSQLRLVMLPGMRQPVFCVDTPMTLDMPRVPSTSKRSGIYWGDLQLELRVPAGTP